MSETITFRELVRKIHPDHNPNVQDAGDKMRQATLFRNQPEELYKLAVRWGLIAGVRPEFDLRWSEPETPRPQPQAPPRPARPEPSRPVYDWRAFFNEEPVEGGHVCVTTRDRTRVQVVRVTPKRVYFYIDGKRHFAHRKNVYVVRNVRVG